MRSNDAALPIVLIVIGVLWLLWSLDWFPDPRSVAGWTLIAAGVALLAIDGITRKSIVAGPFLVVMGLLWFAHIEWRTPYRVVVPIALIVLGLLMLIARLPMIPDRRRPRATESGAAQSPPSLSRQPPAAAQRAPESPPPGGTPRSGPPDPMTPP